MADWLHLILSVASVFGASLVECAEALTVILAVGAMRGWRLALIGAGIGLAFLAGLVLVLGQAMAQFPIELVRAAVGMLLLLLRNALITESDLARRRRTSTP